MKYNNENVRRQDRVLDETLAYNLLVSGEYGVLSMATDNKSGYGIPINYVWDGENSIYFHCATEGEKLINIASCPLVSFCVVGNTKVISDKFTTEYESIILKGEAIVETNPEKRIYAFELFLNKYSPNDKEIGMKYAQKSFDRTVILRLDIIQMSGKTKSIK